MARMLGFACQGKEQLQRNCGTSQCDVAWPVDSRYGLTGDQPAAFSTTATSGIYVRDLSSFQTIDQTEGRDLTAGAPYIAGWPSRPVPFDHGDECTVLVHPCFIVQMAIHPGSTTGTTAGDILTPGTPVLAVNEDGLAGTSGIHPAAVAIGGVADPGNMPNIAVAGLLGVIHQVAPCPPRDCMRVPCPPTKPAPSDAGIVDGGPGFWKPTCAPRWAWVRINGFPGHCI